MPVNFRLASNVVDLAKHGRFYSSAMAYGYSRLAVPCEVAGLARDRTSSSSDGANFDVGRVLPLHSSDACSDLVQSGRSEAREPFHWRILRQLDRRRQRSLRSFRLGWPIQRSRSVADRGAVSLCDRSLGSDWLAGSAEVPAGLATARSTTSQQPALPRDGALTTHCFNTRTVARRPSLAVARPVSTSTTSRAS